MKPRVLLAVLSICTSVICAYGDSIVIFNPDSDISNFAYGDAAYVSRISKTSTTEYVPAGSSAAMKLTTLTGTQTTSNNWALNDATSGTWGNGGNTTGMLSSPIEVEIYMTATDALNLQEDGYPESNMASTVLTFRLGQNSTNYIGLNLKRGFFLEYTTSLAARTDRTDKWLILSLQRDAAGAITGLKVADSVGGTYTDVESTEYSINNTGAPNWQYTSYKSIQAYGYGDADRSYYIGNMTLGTMIPEPATIGLAGIAFVAVLRRRK